MTVSTLTETSVRQRAPSSSSTTSLPPTTPRSLTSPSSTLASSSKSSFRRVPTTKPPFTIGDIRRAIPPHCFEKPLSTSFGYLFTDLFIVCTLFYLSTYISTLFPDALYGPRLAAFLRHCVWLLYWVAQGSVMTGLWVIGHECGHGGFAKEELVNDVVGLIVHSALLVPYFAWKISHRRHHSNTASIEKDEVFVPSTSTKEATEYEDEEPSMLTYSLSSIHRGTRIVFMLTLGWPLYLFFNLTGNKSYSRNAWVNHFSPSSPIFDTGSKDHTNAHLILISDLALLVAISILSYLSYLYTFTAVLYTYLIPYLIVNLFLVLITFLQHTSHSLPHYTSDEWDWLRGALATVDRSYGSVLNVVFHHITDTHVAHHLFSNMAHYHAQEATESIKKVIGDYYLWDNTPIVEALWHAYGTCKEVKQDKQQNGVWWY